MTELPQTEPAPRRGRPSPILIIFLVFPILGIIAAIVTALVNLGGNATVVPTPLAVTLSVREPLMDKPAANFELAGLDGARFRLSSYRGRVTFINFWATWCEPCQRELPAFQKFIGEQKSSSGPVILAVNVNETVDQIKTYFKDNHIQGSLPILLDSNLDVYSAYNIQKLPTTYVLDKTGVVRYEHLGEMTADDLNAYVTQLSQ
jgi:thiol-disulfide isomerase/thioredoxin